MNVRHSQQFPQSFKWLQWKEAHAWQQCGCAFELWFHHSVAANDKYNILATGEQICYGRDHHQPLFATQGSGKQYHYRIMREAELHPIATLNDRWINVGNVHPVRKKMRSLLLDSLLGQPLDHTV